MLKVVELFAGIGAFRQAMKNLNKKILVTQLSLF